MIPATGEAEASNAGEQLAKEFPQYDLKGEFFADEFPQHRVRITKPFYMDIHEVTNAQFSRFMPENIRSVIS